MNFMMSPATLSQSQSNSVTVSQMIRVGLTVVIFSGLLLAFYWQALVDLVDVWKTDPNYSHGFLIPLFSLAFAIIAARETRVAIPKQVDTRDVITGSAEILLGIALHFVGWFSGNLLLEVVSLICVMRGIILAAAGSQSNRQFGFAVLFLIFMAPLPVAWYQPIAVWMQQIAASFSAWLLNITGVPAFREGFTIHLSGHSLEVGEACSGLRQLTAIVGLSAAVGYLMHRGNWLIWSLMAFALPIAVLANASRIVLTGWTLVLLGEQWAKGVYHTFEGLAVLVLATAMILIAATLFAVVDRSFHRIRHGGDTT
jgi:exosortase